MRVTTRFWNMAFFIFLLGKMCYLTSPQSLLTNLKLCCSVAWSLPQWTSLLFAETSTLSPTQLHTLAKVPPYIKLHTLHRAHSNSFQLAKPGSIFTFLMLPFQHIQSNDFHRGCQDHSVGEGIVFSANYVRKLDIHMQTKGVGL